MGNSNDGSADDEEIVIDELPADPAEGQEDKTDWKAEATKHRGIAQRFKTKLEKNKTATKLPESKGADGDAPKPGELDRLDKILLRQEKITDPKEVELVQSMMKESGKSLEQLLDSKFFQNELKDLREAKVVEDATPGASKRSGQSSRDSVDYWIAKGELPPIGETKLRQEVVKAKIAKEKNKSQFTENPII